MENYEVFVESVVVIPFFLQRMLGTTMSMFDNYFVTICVMEKFIVYTHIKEPRFTIDKTLSEQSDCVIFKT